MLNLKTLKREVFSRYDLEDRKLILKNLRGTYPDYTLQDLYTRDLVNEIRRQFNMTALIQWIRAGGFDCLEEKNRRTEQKIDKYLKLAKLPTLD